MKMWKFIWAYFQDKVEIPGFSEDEVTEISLELLGKDDKAVIIYEKRNKVMKFLTETEGIEGEE